MRKTAYQKVLLPKYPKSATYLKRDLPGENMTWKYIAYLEQHIQKHRCFDDGQFWKSLR